MLLAINFSTQYTQDYKYTQSTLQIIYNQQHSCVKIIEEFYAPTPTGTFVFQFPEVSNIVNGIPKCLVCFIKDF